MSRKRSGRPDAAWILLLVFLVSPVFATRASAEEAPKKEPPKIRWTAGPGPVDLGQDLARIEIGEDHLFADGDDARKIMEFLGNPPTDTEVGLIMPAGDTTDWFLVFEYNEVGYVPDDDKDTIDPDAILDSIRRGTEASNKIRKKTGTPALKILGWHEKPHYDPKSHNLVWATLAETEGGGGNPTNVNYNIRLLGRRGYMSAILVTDPGTLEAATVEAKNLIATFSYKPGRTYAEFVKGDKVAEYGLTALVAGGAGAAAAKMGLFKVLGNFLAKMWKVLVAGLVAAGAGIRKIFTARRRQDGGTHPA